MWGHAGAYGDWAEFLRRWGAREVSADAAPSALVPDDFAPETWQRLVTRLHDAIQTRLDAWQASLVAELGSAQDAFSIGRALTHGRDGLAGVLAIARMDALPDDLRGQIHDQLVGQVRSLQQQLEERAEQMRRGSFDSSRETLLRALRENPLTAVIDAPRATGDGAPGVAPDPWATAGAAPRRRVVLD